MNLSLNPIFVVVKYMLIKKNFPINFEISVIFENNLIKTNQKRMSCFTSQDFSKISTTPPQKAFSLPVCQEENDEKIVKLPRGGYLIKTLIGNLQFGMPPETIKDVINMQLEMPLHYIVPTARFNRKYGLN